MYKTFLNIGYLQPSHAPLLGINKRTYWNGGCVGVAKLIPKIDTRQCHGHVLQSEINEIESIIEIINTRMTWRFHLVECAMLSYYQLKMFMQNHILNTFDLLKWVKHNVIRYDMQNHGSLHAHIMLWIHRDDITHIANEIIAHISCDESNHNQ